MKQKALLSHSLSVWLSWILGLLAIVAGGLIIVVALTAWEPVRESLEAISDGLHSARSAVVLIGEDFGTSSSLVSDVSNSIRSTSDIVHETWVTINSIKDTTEEVRRLILSGKQSIETLPPSIMSLIGSDHFTQVLSNLNSTYSTSGQTVVEMQHLLNTLQPVELLLYEVADGVDSLAGDLFSTEEAFNEATEHLEKAAGTIESATNSPILPLIVVGIGLIPMLLGLYLLIQGIALRKLYQSRPIKDTD